MAGGAGIESYFGYSHDHSDITVEDFRSRDEWWGYVPCTTLINININMMGFKTAYSGFETCFSPRTCCTFLYSSSKALSDLSRPHATRVACRSGDTDLIAIQPLPHVGQVRPTRHSDHAPVALLAYEERRPARVRDGLLASYCLAELDAVYLLYLPTGSSANAKLNLAAVSASALLHVQWFNPRTGEGTAALGRYHTMPVRSRHPYVVGALLYRASAQPPPLRALGCCHATIPCQRTAATLTCTPFTAAWVWLSFCSNRNRPWSDQKH